MTKSQSPIEFFNTLLLFNKNFSLETHEKLELKIVAIKRESIFEIFYIRIEFLSKVDDIQTRILSKEEKAIGIREILNCESLISRIEIDNVGKYFYQFEDLKLYFGNELNELKIPNLQKALKVGCQNPFILSSNQFFLYFNDKIYSPSYRKQGTELSETRFYNEESEVYINGDNFFQNFMQVKFGLAIEPEIVAIFPIKSFKLSHSQYERDMGRKICFYLRDKKDLLNSIYITYKIDEHPEKNLTIFGPAILPISIPERGNVKIIVYWNGDEDLIRRGEIIYEESIPIFNLLDTLFSELDKVEAKNLEKDEIAKEYSKIISNLEKEDVIGALNQMKYLAELINEPKIIEWINLELNGYMGSNKFYPEYRRINAKIILRDSNINMREFKVVKEPIGEILNMIERKENLVIYPKDDDEYLVFSQINNVNLSHYSIESNILRQIVFGIVANLNRIIKRSKIVKILPSKVLDRDEKTTPEGAFIEQNFEAVNLHDFEEFKELINQIAVYKDFIKTLPILLRILFEHLLYQIYLTGLEKKHMSFFFNPQQARPRDFSELIALLNILKDREFKMYCKGALVQKHIEDLLFFRKLGNYEVHQIFTQIENDFPIQHKERINSSLKVLLNLYSNLINEKISLSKETIEIIENKLSIAPEKKDQIINNKKMPLDEYSIKEKIANDFYQYLSDLFSRLEEIEKPPNDNSFKDNANYIYFRFEIWDEEHEQFLGTEEAKHLIIGSSDRLKNFYSTVCEKSYEEIKEKLYGYFLKFTDYRIKIEVNRVSIHRSKQYLFKDSSALKEVLDYILSEVINLSQQHGVKIQYAKSDQKLSDERIETIKRHFNELFGFLDKLIYSGINSNELRWIISYITNNEQDFQNYLRFHREPSKLTNAQNFYFLRGKYRINFFFNTKPNIYLNFDELHFATEEEPEKAKEAYSKIKLGIIENLRSEFKIDL